VTARRKVYDLKKAKLLLERYPKRNESAKKYGLQAPSTNNAQSVPDAVERYRRRRTGPSKGARLISVETIDHAKADAQVVLAVVASVVEAREEIVGLEGADSPTGS
jgi:hypothetical protein